MKKIFSLCLVLVLFAGVLSACSGQGTKESAPASSGNDSSVQTEGTLSIVTTIFPEYEWTKQILGENPGGAKVTLLLDNGVDLHSYQPTAEDILNISNCDMFLYVGGESDAWVDDALAEAANKKMVVINLLEALGDQAKQEELVEGMEAEEEEAEEEGTEYDEHVWLSLKNASILCDTIAEGLCKIDPEHADVYQANAASYEEKLSALDEAYTEAAREADVKTLLFGDRFPFRYLTDDYGLEYYAAFAGCSAETEASFETILFLADKVDTLGLTHIMTIEGNDHSIAETILQNTKSKEVSILTLDSMQSTTAKDVEEGVTYLSIMERNLDVLKEAFN